jgi:type III restriction enzyme
VRGLIDFNDISYDDQAALLYKLAGQTVAHLRSYLKDENEVLNVLQYHQQGLVTLIHAQMQEHYEERATAYEAHVSKGFTTLRPNNYSAPANEAERDFRAPVIEKQDIRKMLFSGFKKCLYRAEVRFGLGASVRGRAGQRLRGAQVVQARQGGLPDSLRERRLV